MLLQRLVLLPIVFLALCATSRGGVISWGALSLSDDNAGVFITGATATISGPESATYQVSLPNYQASNFDSTFFNQLNFSVQATALSGVISNVAYSISGRFADDPNGLGPATADYQLFANASTVSGSFPPPATVNGLLLVTPATVLNLSGQFNLHDNGGSAAVFNVTFNLNVPEPAPAALLGGGLLLLGWFKWRRPVGKGRHVMAGLLAGVVAFSGDALAQVKPQSNPNNGISPMGRLARLVKKARAVQPNQGNGLTFGIPPEECEDCTFDPDFTFPGGGFNSEIAVAVDGTGQNIVVGFNDARGFNTVPFRLSGVAYSLDGGLTFTDGGQLPPGPTEVVSGTTVPQIFGDPDVKWVPGGAGCQFVYSSIMVKRFPATGTATGFAQTMSVHVSTDCGVTWSNPIEVTAATNPHGATTSGSASDDADKEFIDVDPDTGRVLMAWTNFTLDPLPVEIRTSFSDNLFSGSPTWSPGVVVTSTASGYFNMGVVPRFLGGGSNNVYLTFGRASLTVGTPYSGFSMDNVGFAKSTDNGVTWGPVTNLRGVDYYPPDYILGNDRIHSFPGMAVDNSGGPNSGNIYIAYSENTVLADGADVMIQRSTNGGTSFSPAVNLSSRPGAGRPQWFPYVTVDKTTGRVSVFYYDQGVAAAGDLTQVTWLYSDDGGVTWSKPTGLCAPPIIGSGATNSCDRPFRAGFGNDTSQPNLGDYIGSDARLGSFYAAFAGTPKIVNYTDGQPSAAMTTPEVRFKKLTTGQAAIDLGAITFTESGGNGFMDAGDQVRMFVGLRNYLTNAAIGTVTYTSVSATLSTTTAGVTILRATSSYPNLAPGATQSNSPDFVFQISPAFVPGTKIEFKLVVTTAQATASLAFSQNTGTPVPATIFSENFNGVATGTLPAGWTSAHGGGNNTVPWTTSNTFCGTPSNALFHVNANNGLSGNHTRWERGLSPSLVIPAAAQYVTMEFDVCYDTEDAPDFNILAYDGLTLRVTDLTPGRTLRSVLLEAFAEELTTGGIQHFPKHLPRGNSAAYLEDMSVWAGGNGAGPSGFQHVRARLPGMQGSTVQLRWEFTQDSFGICTDARPGARTCGVMVDNIVINSVTLKSDELARITLVPVPGTAGTFTGTVTSQPIAAAGGILVNLSSSNPGITTMPASVTIPAGSQNSPPFSVVISPAVSGTTLIITATGPSNARSAGIRIP